jgi:hypothetical protein
MNIRVQKVGAYKNCGLRGLGLGGIQYITPNLNEIQRI